MRTHQNGAAIVIAMGVVALAAIASTGLLVSQSTWARRAELASNNVQAKLVLRTGLDWARAVLSDDLRVGRLDHSGEAWAMRVPPIPVENGSLTGHIEDEQGKFNLNNLLQEGKISLSQLARLRRLLSVLSLPSELADTLADWIDPDDQPQPGSGAEDDYYLSLPSPYLAANRPLKDLAELALVRGFEPEVLMRLRPFVAALPHITAVNVNTASAEVIFATVAGLPLDEARAIVTRREHTIFRSADEFMQRLPEGLAVLANDIAVGSSFFLAQMWVTVGESRARGSALLERGQTGWPVVLWRKYS